MYVTTSRARIRHPKREYDTHIPDLAPAGRRVICCLPQRLAATEALCRDSLRDWDTAGDDLHRGHGKVSGCRGLSPYHVFSILCAGHSYVLDRKTVDLGREWQGWKM